MSSRALRRAQREKEEQKRLRRASEAEIDGEDGDDDDDNDDDGGPAPATKTSMFAMLDDRDEGDSPDETPGEPTLEEPETPAAGARRKKKRKKKGKRKSSPPRTSNASTQLEEIEQAIRSLDLELRRAWGGETASPRDGDAQPYNLLAIDTQHLQAANEMRRLFGRAALQGAYDDDDDNGGPLGLRRNVFVQGKEEWPRGTSGGLGMEVVERHSDGTTEYRFVHGSAYQDVQRQFLECVAIMDHERMISLLRFNPYHVATLLQVSEIAKQERDHTTSGDLLERALFSFGRAVHSTFAAKLAQGKARLDFASQENREFWLAAWRYVSNLGMRATWRTVFEWARLTLSLDPAGDPYGVCLALDQFALRARQPKAIVDLAESPWFEERWRGLCNVQYSVGLAHVQAGDARLGREKLRSAIEDAPWVAAALFRELNLEPIPPAIWGRKPRSLWETLSTRLYVSSARDLWNTPEATALLSEVASYAKPDSAQVDDRPISDNVARHVLLVDKPELVSLVASSIKGRDLSSFDPLPPPQSLSPYRIERPRPTSREQMQQELDDLTHFFLEQRQLFESAQGDASDEARLHFLAETGISMQTMQERLRRVQELMVQLGGAHRQEDD
ncbi:transcriptional repressor TCF25-domain-containing protein [Lineolata rhizophorae]|uniref:Transcriptional repressor TCF25-domain-containing protein n=1 Tax=Lineolata rhizophorae TaxID=578093 RepID=A0A6A6PD92_9PEZI|nr:transcriptional repressor TCF25-domain-containing protein [Lineolata rhizophorae]